MRIEKGYEKAGEGIRRSPSNYVHIVYLEQVCEYLHGLIIT